MPTMPAVNLTELLKDIPQGAWVAISNDEARVVAFGAELRTVMDEARVKGESDPISTRVPETASAVML